MTGQAVCCSIFPLFHNSYPFQRVEIMRDTYYQAVGNPVQTERLPASQPQIEILPPAVPLSVTLPQVAGRLAEIAVAGFVTLILYRPPGVAWLEPYDLVLAVPVLAAAVGMWIVSGQERWVLHPLFLAAVAIVYVNHRTPWGLQVVTISVAAAVLAYAFGRHWRFICTASPLCRSTANQLRADWQQQLFILAGIAGLLTAALLWSGFVLLKLAILTLPVAAAIVRLPDGLRSSRWQVLLDSLVLWFTYDPRSLPGLLQSPVGSKVHLAGLTVLAAVLTAVLLVRWQDSPLPQLLGRGAGTTSVCSPGIGGGGASHLEQLRYASLTWVLTFIAVASLPIVVPCVLTVSVTMPVLLEAAAQLDQAACTQRSWSRLIRFSRLRYVSTFPIITGSTPLWNTRRRTGRFKVSMKCLISSRPSSAPRATSALSGTFVCKRPGSSTRMPR